MKPIIAITMGDPAGIGSEIAVKAIERHGLYNECLPVVIGDFEAIKDAINFTKSSLRIKKVNSTAEVSNETGVIYLLDLSILSQNSWQYKKVGVNTGEASFQYIKKGIELALDNQVHAVVTGPINKESLNIAGYHYSGHTEIFAHMTNTPDCAMLLSSPDLKVIHVTTHVSMREACERITKERVLTVIRLADTAMKLVGVTSPRIAIAGLNAHSSENGLFGTEEERFISPAIAAAKAEHIDAEGPVPPDTVFVKAIAGMYDIVVAMYHDQGHIPVKLNGFKMDLNTKRFLSVSGVNTTIGLPIIRTSVDHGTAFGKAGEGRANEESMVDAVLMAATMAKNKFHLH